MATLLTVLYLLIVPWAVIRLEQRWKWIEKISPITILYTIGLAVSNVGLLSSQGYSICSSLSSLAVPLAIPLMLMGCSIDKGQLGKALRVFLSGLLAVMIVVVAGFYLFKNSGSLTYQENAQICAVATGIYTGGIPNIGAVAQGVSLPNHLYLLVTSCDLIITGIYLIFIIFFGRQVFRTLLPYRAKNEGEVTETSAVTPTPRIRPFDRQHYKGSLLLLGATVVIAALSYGVTLLPSKGAETNMTLLILVLTTLALGASFIKPIQKQQQSFDMGLYCVYVFCLAIASQVRLGDLQLAENISILYYITFVIFGSLLLQILFARMLKIDGDSVLVCSIALINSPPFVPMVAAILNNRRIVVLGISIGLLGYMIGNYLGIGIYHLLMALA